MKKEKIIAISIIAIFIIFGSFYALYKTNNNSEKLCVYKIPNQIKFNCQEGNDTRTINYFQVSLFEYNNALSQGCNNTEELDDYGYRYEISKCDESIPFEIFQ